MELFQSLKWRVPMAVIAGGMACSPMLALPADQPDLGSQRSAMLIQWATSNKARFTEIYSYSRNAPRPTAVTPPELDPPCRACDDASTPYSQAQVDAWLKQVEDPEVSYIGDWMTMSGQYQILMKGITSSDLSSPATHALRDFLPPDSESWLSVARSLAQRIFSRAEATANAYDTNPKMAYAGTRFLMDASRQEDLVGNADPGDSQAAIQLSQTWTQAVVNKIDSEILEGKQYNLCPAYISIIQDLEKTGGSADVQRYEETVQKMQEMLTFDVTLKLHATMSASDGSKTDAAWSGKARMKINLDGKNSCYKPEWQDGGEMAIKVDNWSMIVMDKEGNGPPTPVSVALVSPHSYQGSMDPPHVDLCAPQPIFQFPMPTSGIPPEEIQVKGRTEKGAFFGAFLAAIVAANELNNAQTNAVTGGAPSLPGGAPSSSSDSANPSDSAGGQQQLQRDKALMAAHTGDAGWIFSPEGQAVMADMQKQALSMVQTKMASAGVVLPQSSNFQQLSTAMQSLHLPWTNGQAQPVRESRHVKKTENGSSMNYEATVTVSQAP